MLLPLLVDNFAGGGGASCGIKMATGRDVDIAVNHDGSALVMHEANHPGTLHLCEDVFNVNPAEVTNGRKVGLGWFSPSCTHFSRAKGSVPLDSKIRGLATVAVDWARYSDMHLLVLENVDEFRTWGPLRKDGKPDKRSIGKYFNKMINDLRQLGYRVEWKSLKGCDYGAPTSRKRLFMIGRKHNKPIYWPEPTHFPPITAARIGLPAYKTAASCIDWSIPCPSIFDRKKPLVPNTMKRIAKGLWKFIINCENPYIVPEHLALPFLTEHANGSSQRVMSVEDPLRTQCAQVKGGHFALVSAFIAKHYGGPNGNQTPGSSLEVPLHSITAVDHNSVVAATLMRQFGTSSGYDIEKPMPTIMSNGAGGKTGVIAATLTRDFGQSDSTSLHEPMPTVMPGGGGKTNLVEAFLVKYYGSDVGADLNNPLPTITTRDRMGLVTVNREQYVIVDIGMRMLQPHELFKAQGFPADYILNPIMPNGKPMTKGDQVKMVGNSVCPPLAAAIVKANYTGG